MGARGVLRTMAGGLVGFMCPGCKEMHQVRVDGQGRPAWGFNGDYDRPTFTPSVLIRTGHHISTHKAGDPCWCNFEQRTRRKAPFACTICHSFVRDGQIQFLNDCTHALAGQTVPLQPFDEA